jgi:organic hydroperoxide reductase OsmC/OhrA
MTVVFVRPIAGKKLLGSAGRHNVVTDRKEADGGSDAGCTSGELLLLAMASCATGSIHNALAAHKLGTNDIRVEVNLVPPKTSGARDGILITVYLAPPVLAADLDAVVTAAVSGGVVSRIKLGSDVAVACKPLESFPHPLTP